jgi:hypothetical protein
MQEEWSMNRTILAMVAATILSGCGNADSAKTTRTAAFGTDDARSETPDPSRVLNVGCDIGITTCFQAILLPEASITGID